MARRSECHGPSLKQFVPPPSRLNGLTDSACRATQLVIMEFMRTDSICPNSTIQNQDLLNSTTSTIMVIGRE
jgi:hypothetical protein